jgi:Fic family protein
LQFVYYSSIIRLMIFHPNYAITNKMLAYIKEVDRLVNELNHRRFPQVVLVQYQQSAQALSAHASTSIEGNLLPLTEVKKILKNTPQNARDSEREVINYNQALVDLDHQMEHGSIKLTKKLILSIHKKVTQKLLPEFECGHFRQKPVVVNNPMTHQLVFLPPDAAEVPQMVDDLLTYIDLNQKAIDPLILAGIVHKQLVLIHPFMDGNGRTTRLITKTILAQMKLNTFKLFSFENYYNQNVTKYFSLVGEQGNYYDLADKIDFTPWLEYFVAGIIDELLRVSALLPSLSYNPATELLTDQQKLLKLIAQKGYASDSDYAKISKRAKATRALDYQKLIELGLINRQSKGKNTYYILKELR